MTTEKKTRKDGGTLCGWKWWKNHASRQDISVILRMCQVWHISVSICSFWALSHFQKKIATQLGWLQLGLFVLHFFGMNILVKISVSCYDHFVVDLIVTNSIHLGFYLPFEVCVWTWQLGFHGFELATDLRLWYISYRQQWLFQCFHGGRGLSRLGDLIWWYMMYVNHVHPQGEAIW